MSDPGPQGRPTSGGVRRIDHVGIAVADLDQAIEFYETTFGMRCEHREDNAREGVREAMMAVGPDPAATRIQLLAPLSPSSTIGRFLERSGPGLQQVAYTVTDLAATTQTLRGRGVRLLYQTSQRGTAGSLVNFLHPGDTGGVLVELVEPADPVGAADLAGLDDPGDHGAPAGPPGDTT